MRNRSLRVRRAMIPTTAVDTPDRVLSQPSVTPEIFHATLLGAELKGAFWAMISRMGHRGIHALCRNGRQPTTEHDLHDGIVSATKEPNSRRHRYGKLDTLPIHLAQRTK